LALRYSNHFCFPLPRETQTAVLHFPPFGSTSFFVAFKATPRLPCFRSLLIPFGKLCWRRGSNPFPSLSCHLHALFRASSQRVSFQLRALLRYCNTSKPHQHKLSGSFRPRVLRLFTALVAYCLPRFCNPAFNTWLVLGLTPVVDSIIRIILKLSSTIFKKIEGAYMPLSFGVRFSAYGSDISAEPCRNVHRLAFAVLTSHD